MTAYHSDPTLKAEVLASLAEHRRLDQIVQGLYWNGEEHKGCAVGCLTEDPHGGHDQFPERWGIPVQLAYLIDNLFEALPTEEAKAWPERVMSAIPVGADLSGVWDRFALWLLMDPEHGVVNLAGENIAAVQAMGALFARAVAGDEPSEREWARAAEAAFAAEAARAMAAADAAWAANAAEAARAMAAADAAWAANTANAARAARAARAADQCDHLVTLLTSAPVA